MSKAKVIFFAAVLLALSAVGVVAFVASHPTRPTATDHSWLTDELNLTTAQRDKMKEIWTGTMQTVMQKIGERRRTLKDERDAAIMEMLSPEQKLEYDQILQQYGSGVRELDHEREAAFKKATEETKTLLTADQAKKYTALMIERSGHLDHGGGRRVPGPAGGPHRGPDSAPDGHGTESGGVGHSAVHIGGATTAP